ncbi:TPA: hypothetical protein JEO25_000514 [Salmonella enterica subsp. enterica serovar Wangata]|nr:hypothetical protein [Salmonella enterica subsp. enterica serovar Wangata]HAU7803482.1 hypothetical protein [Salmonella enterica subsp. enterica serovar Wangata]
MMKKVMLPADTEQYADLVKEEVAVLHTRMGGACITLNYRTTRVNGHPVLVIDFSANGASCIPCVMICRQERRNRVAAECN